MSIYNPKTIYSAVSSTYKNYGFKKVLYYSYILTLAKLKKYTATYSHKPIVFISEVKDAPMRYRCFNQSEALGKYGIDSDCFELGAINWKKIIDYYQVFVLQRCMVDESVLALLKENHKTIVFDVDDLIFDKQYLDEIDHDKKFSKETRKLIEKRLISLRKIIDKSDYAITSTSMLRDLLERYELKNVYLSKNSISDSQIELAKLALNTKKKNPNVIIGYTSGSKTHDQDLGMIAEPLSKVLPKHPNVKLRLFGYIDLPNELKPFKNQVEFKSYVSWDKYLLELSKFNINIVPLKDNLFNQCKSDIKFIEPGLVGVPTVASYRPEFTSSIIEGQNGFLAANNKDWEEKLVKLIADENLRKTIGENAREYVLENRTTKQSGKILSDIFKEIQGAK